MTIKKSKAEASTATVDDCYSLEGLPGFGPAVLKVLKEEGVTTTEDLAKRDPVWLKEVSGMDKDKAAEAYQMALSRLRKGGKINAEIMSASELYEIQKNMKKISTGCDAVDHVWDGGLKSGYITEIYGEEGGGKTQTSHNFVVQVMRPVAEGGLHEEGKPIPQVFYFDTENTFKPERIMSMLRGKKMISDYPKDLKIKIIEGKVLTADEIKQKEAAETQFREEAKKYLDSIIHIRVMDAYSLVRLLGEVSNMISIDPKTGQRKKPVELIVIDSATYPFRYQHRELGQQKGQKDLLKETIGYCRNMAEISKVAILVVNQIWELIGDAAKYVSDPEQAYGGHVWGHAVHYKYKIEKSGAHHRTKLVKSSHQAQNDVRFDIAETGLVELEK